jgi:hypothetical protein
MVEMGSTLEDEAGWQGHNMLVGNGFLALTQHLVQVQVLEHGQNEGHAQAHVHACHVRPAHVEDIVGAEQDTLVLLHRVDVHLRGLAEVQGIALADALGGLTGDRQHVG